VVANPNFKRRVLYLVMEQTINTYQAKNEAVLDVVTVEIDQIDAVLKAEDENVKHRDNTRRTVVYVSFACLFLIAGFVTYAAFKKINVQEVCRFWVFPHA
jgi:hypothetical protein